MADVQEIEWQLDAVDLRPVLRWLQRFDDTATAPVPGVRATPGESGNQIDRYLDTEDWRFHRAGYTLRIRRKGRRRAEFTLKAIDSEAPGPRRRRELTEPASADSPQAVRDAPGPVGTRVRAVIGGRPLRELFEVRTRRRTLDLAGRDGPIGQVALDETTIRSPDGGPPARLRRVEVEVPASAEAAAAPIVGAMRAECALQPGTLSKFQLGMLSAGLGGPAPPDLGPMDAGPELSLGDVAFAVLRRQFGEFLAQEPGTRLGDDPEFLHDMRVASRRLRAALSLFRPALPVRLNRLRDELEWVGDALGAVRDLDVQLEELDGWIRDLPESDRGPLAALRSFLEEERDAARAALLGILDSPRYERLVRSFGQVLRAGPLRRSTVSRAPVLAAAPDLLERRFRKVRKAGKAIDATSTPADYHALRKRARRFRYALESFADVYQDRTRRLVKRLVAVQDILGEHQDANVAVERLRAIVAEQGTGLPPQTVFAMGEIAERYAREMERLRGEFPDAYRRLTGKAWKRFRREMERLRPQLPDPRERLRSVARPTEPPTDRGAQPNAGPQAGEASPVPDLRPAPTTAGS